jgi:hypothetical protein
MPLIFVKRTAYLGVSGPFSLSGPSGIFLSSWLALTRIYLDFAGRMTML